MKNNIKYSILLIVASFLSAFLGFKMDVYADIDDDIEILNKYLNNEEEIDFDSINANNLDEKFNEFLEDIEWEDDPRTLYEYVCSVSNIRFDSDGYGQEYDTLDYYKKDSRYLFLNSYVHPNNEWYKNTHGSDYVTYYCRNHSDINGNKNKYGNAWFAYCDPLNDRMYCARNEDSLCVMGKYYFYELFKNTVNDLKNKQNIVLPPEISEENTDGGNVNNGNASTGSDSNTFYKKFDFVSMAQRLCSYVNGTNKLKYYINEDFCSNNAKYSACNNSDTFYDSTYCHKLIEFGRDYSNFDYNAQRTIACSDDAVRKIDDYKEMCYQGMDSEYCYRYPGNYECLFLRAFSVKTNFSESNCPKDSNGNCTTVIKNLNVNQVYTPPKDTSFEDWYVSPEGNTSEDCTRLFDEEIRGLINSVFGYIRVLVPVLVIVLGSVDLFKAVISSNEDDMKKAQKHFIKRVIFGLAVFLAPSLINILMWAVEKGLNIGNYGCQIDFKL